MADTLSTILALVAIVSIFVYALGYLIGDLAEEKASHLSHEWYLHGPTRRWRRNLLRLTLIIDLLCALLVVLVTPR